jgi:hypothetical protein
MKEKRWSRLLEIAWKRLNGVDKARDGVSAHHITRLGPLSVTVYWCLGVKSHRCEPFLCEIGLDGRFTREPGTYDCDEHV